MSQMKIEFMKTERSEFIFFKSVKERGKEDIQMERKDLID